MPSSDSESNRVVRPRHPRRRGRARVRVAACAGADDPELESRMDQLLAFERALNGYVWGGPMIALLIGTGVLLTILTGFVQFRRLGTALREVLGHIFTRTHAAGSVTPFQAVATALASTVGVGNIAGV